MEVTLKLEEYLTKLQGLFKCIIESQEHERKNY